MPDEQRVARTTRCPDPSAPVAKQLFGTAVKCGRPTCNEILYRMENGRPALNCRMAHIRASAPNGPRADPLMTCAEVNTFENLLLLCPYDAALVDDSWEEHPVEVLADWKRQQIDQAALLGVARQPTDDEISQLIVESRQHDTVTRAACVDLARTVRRLRSEAERTRTEPQEILREQQQAERQLNRRFLGFDPETGERSQAQLSRDEERRFAGRIVEALSHSRGPVEAAAAAVLADAAGVAAAAGPVATDARSWVERSVAEVVRLASKWNDELGSALDRLDAAGSALVDTAAGRTTFMPPPPEPPEPLESSPLDLFFERCREVHERAARHARVDHLPFDAALHVDVLDLASDCAGVPAVLSLVQFGSDHNAALGAAILKNADDEQFARAVDGAAALQPEAAAAQHLRHLHFFASERGWSERLELVQAALDGLSTRIIERSGSHEFWERNVEHGSFILRCAEATIGAENVTAALRRALTNPTLLEPILVALSETVEERGRSTMEFLGIRRRYSEPGGPIEGLPRFIPVAAICTAIEQRWPARLSARGPEIERLAAEFRMHRCASC